MPRTKVEQLHEWSEEFPLLAKDIVAHMTVERGLNKMISAADIPDDYARAGDITSDPYMWSSLGMQSLQDISPGSVLLRADPWSKQTNIKEEESWQFVSPIAGLTVYAPPDRVQTAKHVLNFNADSRFSALPYGSFLKPLTDGELSDPTALNAEQIASILPELQHDQEQAVATIRGGFMLSVLRNHVGSLGTPGNWLMASNQYGMGLPEQPNREAYEAYRQQGYAPMSGEAIGILGVNATRQILDQMPAGEQ
jgi:hypothetical protein